MLIHTPSYAYHIKSHMTVTVRDVCMHQLKLFLHFSSYLLNFVPIFYPIFFSLLIIYFPPTLFSFSFFDMHNLHTLPLHEPTPWISSVLCLHAYYNYTTLCRVFRMYAPVSINGQARNSFLLKQRKKG